MIHETYTAKEIAKEYFADGILWDLPWYKSCIEGDKPIIYAANENSNRSWRFDDKGRLVSNNK